MPFGRLLGRLGHHIGSSWGVLEASWRRLGRIFESKWRQVGIKTYKIMDLMFKLLKSWKPYFSDMILIILRFQGSKLGVKIDPGAS